MNSVGIGSRVINFVVDFLLVFILAFAASRVWNFYVFYYHWPYFSFYYFLGVVTFIYYLFFEGIWGRSPGKWLSLSKVVNNQGAKPSFMQVAVRSLARVAGMVLIDSLFLSFFNKTLHDYVSRTNVIEV